MASPSATSHLAPGYLVAAPALRDPNFSGTLVLMAGHRREGAMGFVVNRPAPLSAPALLDNVDARLAALARARAGAGAEVPVLVGGPVAGDQLWILHRRSRNLPDDGEGVLVGRHLALGSSLPLLEALLRAEDPGPFLLLVGYAGWAPLQLENEIAHGAWVPMEFAEDLAFTVPVATRWEEAVRRLGLDPAGFAVGGGGAMA